MTARAPWPLLTELDELLACEGWQDDECACEAFEVAIASQTHVLGSDPKHPRAGGIVSFREGCGFMQPGHVVDVQFLRSRDAAAMLEEAILFSELWKEFNIDMTTDARFNHSVTWLRSTKEADTHVFAECRGTTEATARTRAALEAGFSLGLWPVKEPA